MADIDARWEELGAFIREQRRIGQLSLRRLSEMAGISNPYLSQIERGLRKPSAEILRQIAGALQISAETLYVRAGILDEPDGEHDLEASIRRDPYLDEEHRRTLVHIYRSFRAAHVAARGLQEADVDAGTDETAADDAAAVDAVTDETATDQPEASGPDSGEPEPDADGHPNSLSPERSR